MKKIDVYFLLLATILLLCGVSLGIHMGMAQDFQLAPVHAHINLVGWVSLALFGLTYRAYPELKARALTRWHFGASSIGAVLMGPGLYAAIIKQSDGLITVAATFWLIGVVLFLIQIIALLRATAD